MNYLVLPRKWRPQRFSEILGQEHIIRTLTNVIQQKRIAHAYLFVGPRGVGKTSLARILAKSLNCEKGPVIEPCQKCTSCTDITQGKSLDVIEIDGASNRGIEEIRQLRENIKFSPVHGQFRIYIIDEVHMLTPEAFNALLKTLEEPPPHVKFIFATTSPQRLPATILSRCQRFNFRLISVKELVSQLRKISSEEKITISDEALYRIARQADGSVRDAESILDQLAGFAEKKIEEKDVFLLMGHVSKDIFFKFIESILNKNLAGTISYFNQIIDRGEAPQELLADALQHLRNLLFIKIGKEGESQLDIIEEDLAILRTHASKVDEKETMSLIDIFSSATQDMRWSSSPRLLMEVILIKAIRTTSPSLPIKPLSQDISSLQKSKIIPASNGFTLEEIRARWPRIIEAVKKEKMTVGACLAEGEPIKFHHPVVTISFDNGYSFHRETVEKIENKKLVEKIFRDIFKQDLIIHCLSNNITSPDIAIPPANPKPRTLPHHDMIDKVLKLFNGKIVEDNLSREDS